MYKITIIAILTFLVGCYPTHKNNIDLSGEWKIRLDQSNVGIHEKWYSSVFDEKIMLPGSLQEQGYGNDIDTSTQWTGDLNDRSWFIAPEYRRYREKGNIKFPYWLSPDKHYVGVAWYQKEINIPPEWKNKTVFLNLERTHWESTLYVDDVKIGEKNVLSTPHRYELSNMSTGKHTVTIRVDNRLHIPVGVNAHSVSDHTQSNWNGMIGSLALEVKAYLFIDDIQVYPDIKTKKIRVNISLKGKTASGKANVQMRIENLKGELVGNPVSVKLKDFEKEKELEVILDAGNDVLLWSEHQPNVYKLKTIVSCDGETEEQHTQFGFREFIRDGTRFQVNGRPIFLRGTLECCIFPITGYPSMDGNYWKKIYLTCKEFGLNHVRFHSWCPPKVAFEVADTVGIYLQVECPAWTTVGNGEYIDQWLYEEGDRILKEYGNHPSFCMMASGNEPGGADQVQYLSDLVAYWKKKDNRRVYTSAAGWPYVENADYWNAPNPRIQAWGQGLHSIINVEAPRSDYDFAHIIRQDMPTVSHEIGQWCVYPNFREIEKYTGVLKAKNFEIFRETLQNNNMGDLSDDFLYASGKLQTLCYKADIEAALRTPEFAGFQLLDLHDFPGQGTALVGVLDPFWDTKGYVDGKEYSMFCNETVPLIRFPKMIFQNNEILAAPVEIAHFGEKPLKKAKIIWTIIAADKQVYGRGDFTTDIPIGNCIPAGQIQLALNVIDKPTQLTVFTEIENTSIKNQWNIWVYPAEKPHIEQQPYITSKLDNATIERLNKGENVLLLLPRGSIRPEKGGSIAVGFSSIFWNTAWTRKQAPHTLGLLCDPGHPALASFPNDGYSDYQWWDIVSNADAMIMDDFPADFRPIIHLIDDWFTNRKLGILFETRVGKGRLIVCSVDLQKDMEKRPAAAQFKQSILEYMTSNRFNPQQEISIKLIKELL